MFPVQVKEKLFMARWVCRRHTSLISLLSCPPFPFIHADTLLLPLTLFSICPNLLVHTFSSLFNALLLQTLQPHVFCFTAAKLQSSPFQCIPPPSPFPPSAPCSHYRSQCHLQVSKSVCLTSFVTLSITITRKKRLRADPFTVPACSYLSSLLTHIPPLGHNY